jgi:hypothetical protein
MNLLIESIPWDRVIMLISVCALSAYAGTEVARQLLRGWLTHSGKKRPWWRAGALKSLSVVLGGVAGFVIGGSVFGLIVGVGSGGITTSVVSAIKARIKGAGGGK